MLKHACQALVATAVLFSPVMLLALDTPAQIVLNAEGEYYAEVEFDHAMHEEVGECDACHHHTTGGGTTDSNCVECHADSPAAATVACRGCHVAEPYSAAHLQEIASQLRRYHVDMPGSKGAFHRNCLGCHEQQDGPVGCQDCHERTPTGDSLYAGTLGEKK